jgi:hypothetical protein
VFKGDILFNVNRMRGLKGIFERALHTCLFPSFKRDKWSFWTRTVVVRRCPLCFAILVPLVRHLDDYGTRSLNNAVV